MYIFLLKNVGQVIRLLPNCTTSDELVIFTENLFIVHPRIGSRLPR